MSPADALDAICEHHAETMLATFRQFGGDHDTLAAIAEAIIAQVLTLALRHPEYARALSTGIDPAVQGELAVRIDSLPRAWPIESAVTR